MPGGVAGERPMKAAPYADLAALLHIRNPSAMPSQCSG